MARAVRVAPSPALPQRPQSNETTKPLPSALCDTFTRRFAERNRAQLMRLQNLVQTLEPRAGAKVLPGDAWHYEADKRVLRYPKHTVLAHPLPYNMGAVCREVARCRYAQLPRQAVAQDPGCALVWAAVDSIRTSNLLSARYAGVQRLLQEVYRQDCRDSDGRGPLLAQYAGACMAYWRKDEARLASYDPRVRAALQTTAPFLDKAVALPPGVDLAAAELPVARRRALSRSTEKIVLRDIWPVLKALAEKDPEWMPPPQALEEAEKILGGAPVQEAPPTGAEGEGNAEGAEGAEGAKGAKGEAGNPGTQAANGGQGVGGNSNSNSNDDDDDGDGDGDGDDGDSQAAQGTGAARDEGSAPGADSEREAAGDGSQADGKPAGADSAAAQHATGATSQAGQNSAPGAADSRASTAGAQAPGERSQASGPHAEQGADGEASERRDEGAEAGPHGPHSPSARAPRRPGQASSAPAGESSEHVTPLTPEEEALWRAQGLDPTPARHNPAHRVRAAHARVTRDAAGSVTAQGYRDIVTRYSKQIDDMVASLEEAFRKERQPRYVGHFKAGRYDLKKAVAARFREQATGVRDPKVFLRRDEPTERSVAFVVCADRSGSMWDMLRYRYLQEALAILLEAGREAGLNVAMLAYDHLPQRLKELDEELDDDAAAALLEQVIPGGANAEVAALNLAEEMVAESDATEVCIVFITDGGGDLALPEHIAALRDRDPRVQVMGVGIGAGCDEVPRLYDKHRLVPSVEELPACMGSLLVEVQTGSA